jgi:hypothetical protein
MGLFPRAEAHKLEIYSGDNILLAPHPQPLSRPGARGADIYYAEDPRAPLDLVPIVRLLLVLA